MKEGHRERQTKRDSERETEKKTENSNKTLYTYIDTIKKKSYRASPPKKTPVG